MGAGEDLCAALGAVGRDYLRRGRIRRVEEGEGAGGGDGGGGGQEVVVGEEARGGSFGGLGLGRSRWGVVQGVGGVEVAVNGVDGESVGGGRQGEGDVAA